ncbi:major intrinsic protein, partial [Guillardia theta CCMP2712]
MWRSCALVLLLPCLSTALIPLPSLSVRVDRVARADSGSFTTSHALHRFSNRYKFEDKESIRALRGGSSYAQDFSPQLPKALMAEMLGTWMIVFLGTAAVATANFAKAEIAGLLGIACCWGIAVAGAVSAFAKVSGSHFNPAISIALAWYKGKFGTPLTIRSRTWLPLYILAQLVGALCASGCVALLYKSSFAALPLSAAPAAMGCYPSRAFGSAETFAAELLGTGLLAFGAISLQSAWQLGAWLATLIVVFAPISGASFNPARELGPRIVSMLMGFDASKVLTPFLPVYILGPILGAVIGVWVASSVAKN